MGKKIHIVQVFDNAFWAPAFATMRSVCLTTHRAGDLVFHAYFRDVDLENQDKLKSLVAEFGCEINFYDVDADKRISEVLMASANPKRTTNLVFVRLVLHLILPKTIKRLVYLDSDMLVLAPIEVLAEADLQGNSIAAVPDPVGLFIAGGRDVRAKKHVFDSADRYFNAGLMVLDLEAIRKTSMLDTYLKMARGGEMNGLYHDQDFLNIFFRNNWLQLDPLWNLTNPHPTHESLLPFLLHYTGKNKPWNLMSKVGHARTYRHVMTNEIYYGFLRHRIARRLKRFVPFLN